MGDVRDMPSIPTRSIDIAFDKGTLDAMIHRSPWSPPDEVMENTGRYMKEVYASLRLHHSGMLMMAQVLASVER